MMTQTTLQPRNPINDQLSSSNSNETSNRIAPSNSLRRFDFGDLRTLQGELHQLEKALLDEIFADDYDTLRGPVASLHEELIIARLEEERRDLEFLTMFINGTAFYAEKLEEQIGEPLDDFWQAREHAYHLITALNIEHMKREEALGLLRA